MSRFAVLAEFVFPDGDELGGGDVAQGGYVDDVILYLRVLFSGPGDDEQVSGGVAQGGYADDVILYLRDLFSGPGDDDEQVGGGGDDDEQVGGGGDDDEQVGGGDGGQGGGDVEGAGGDGVVRKRTRKIYVPRVYDVGVRVPVVAPYHLNEEYVPFPPFNIRNRRDAKKAAAVSKTGSYGNATISHGSYGDGGNLQY